MSASKKLAIKKATEVKYREYVMRHGPNPNQRNFISLRLEMEERKKTVVLKKRQLNLENMLKMKEDYLKGIKLAKKEESLELKLAKDELERKKEEAVKAATMMTSMTEGQRQMMEEMK